MIGEIIIWLGWGFVLYIAFVTALAIRMLVTGGYKPLQKKYQAYMAQKWGPSKSETGENTPETEVPKILKSKCSSENLE
jgi:short subunit fatty acids transporter